jgi:hypothetical protein
MGEKGQQRWNGGENFADAAYPRKCSGGGFGEDAAESLFFSTLCEEGEQDLRHEREREKITLILIVVLT